MSTKENDIFYERLQQEREEWLQDYGNLEHTYTESDIMEDDEGEYIMVRNDLGGYNFVYLPEELQKKNIFL